jgi:hypothetical protein
LKINLQTIKIFEITISHLQVIEKALMTYVFVFNMLPDLYLSKKEKKALRPV